MTKSGGGGLGLFKYEGVGYMLGILCMKLQQIYAGCVYVCVYVHNCDYTYQAISSTELEIIKQPSVEDDVIRLEVCGTKPITYQWFKNGRKLKDGDDYKGSTAKELLVRKVSEESRGAYHCKVKDKHGMEKDSGEVKFGRFCFTKVNII